MRRKVRDSDISRAVIADSPTEKLEGARKFITSLQGLNSVVKLYDTYYKGISKALEYNQSSNIYYDFKFDGTVTGRLSCAAYSCNEDKMGVSFHTLPRTPEDPNEVNIRSLFLPPEGWYFITADYKTMELRVLAHLSQDPNLLEAIRSGKDLHKATASRLYGVPIEEVTKEQRQIAKAVSFLIVYGGGAYRLSKEVNIPEFEAEEVIQGLKSAYPRIFEWASETEAFLYKNKYVESMFGRRRHLEDIRSPVERIRNKCVKQGGNFRIQSSASEITSFSFLDICDTLDRGAFDTRLVASVHDSIEGVAPKFEVLEVIEMMRYRMVNYPYLRQTYGLELTIPLDVDISVGKSFGNGIDVIFEGNTIKNHKEVLESIGT